MDEGKGKMGDRGPPTIPWVKGRPTPDRSFTLRNTFPTAKAFRPSEAHRPGTPPLSGPSRRVSDVDGEVGDGCLVSDDSWSRRSQGSVSRVLSLCRVDVVPLFRTGGEYPTDRDGTDHTVVASRGTNDDLSPVWVGPRGTWSYWSVVTTGEDSRGKDYCHSKDPVQAVKSRD